MAGGLPTSILLEVEFVPTSGTFVDITTYVDMVDGVTVTRGRADEFSDIQAAQLTVTLFNDTGRFTPESPLSAYWPNVVQGRRIRFTVTKGATTSRRFYGRIAAWELDVGSGEPNDARTTITAVDVFAQLARRDLRCDFVERWLATQRGGEAVDLWPLDDGSDNPTTFRNAAGGPEGRAVYPSTVGVGAITMEPPTDLMADGSVVLSAPSGVGPVVVLPVTTTTTVNDIVIPFRTTDVYSGTQKWLACGLSSAGSVLWSMRLVDNAGQTDLNLYDAAGTFVDTLYFQWAAAGALEGRDQWFALRIVIQAGFEIRALERLYDGTNIHFASSAAIPLASSSTRTVVIGGKPDARLNGRQTNCTNMRVGPVAISDALAAGHIDFLGINTIEPGQTRMDDLAFYTDLAYTTTGTSNIPVTMKQLSDRKADDCIAELARTMGALVVPDYATSDKAVLLKDSDALRLPTVALTIDAENDLDASNGLPLRRATEGRPTRVTATWPAGAITTIGDESEQRLDATVDTCAADSLSALSVASATLNASTSLRMTGVRLDLVTAGTDLYAATLALTEGDRIRTQNLPTTLFGRSRADGYVQGWVESWTRDSAVFEFDTSPADDPVEGVWDDTERGRWTATEGSMTVTSGTAVGTTATGTIVVTTTGGAPTWSTTAGDYPLDVDWNGERVTVTSAPASSSSPQTLTITARGVAPSVARVHAAGERVDVWTGAAWTI